MILWLRRSRSLQLAAALGLALVCLMQTACGNACSELSDLCKTCTDPNVKAQCQLIADAPDADKKECTKALNDGRFDVDCPGK